MSTLAILVAAFVLFLFISNVRAGREHRLQRLRENWGKRVARERRMTLFAEVHRSRLDATPGARSLDDRTWADLGLDDVFAEFDRTESTLGQHALYHRLRSAPVSDDLEVFEALVNRLHVDMALRERAQIALRRLRDPQGYNVWWLARPEPIERPAWYAMFPLFTAAAFVSLALAPWWPAGLFLVGAVNVLVRFSVHRHISVVAQSIRQCAPLIKTASDLAFLAGEDIDALVGPLRADVPRLGRLKLISSWSNADPFLLSFESSILAVSLSELATIVYEYLNFLLLLDATGVYFGTKDVNTHRAALLRVVAATGDVDAAVSVTSYREGTEGWTRPQFQGAGPATLVDLRHPLIEAAVPNSIVLTPGTGVLVTGSNMSGKSTFLRTVGVNVVLAQTLNTCLARQYTAPVFNVHSCIGRSDDLLAGKSYYLVEVEALLGLVRLSESASLQLFLLDELFRGTNAVERIAAGQAVLQELIEGPNTPKPHVVIAATHDGELVDLLPQFYDAYHFGDSIGAEGLVFDHRLKSGRATTRTALALLRQSGAPQRLLERAAGTASLLDNQRAHASFLRERAPFRGTGPNG